MKVPVESDFLKQLAASTKFEAASCLLSSFMCCLEALQNDSPAAVKKSYVLMWWTDNQEISLNKTIEKK